MRRSDIDLASCTVRVKGHTVELSAGERVATPPTTDAGRRRYQLAAERRDVVIAAALETILRCAGGAPVIPL